MTKEDLLIPASLAPKRELLVLFIALMVFALTLIVLGVEGFLQWAFMELYFGQYLPPELLALLPSFSLAQLHDIGIFLSSLGLVFLYLPITLSLVITEQTKTLPRRLKDRLVYLFCHTNLFNILGFLGLFLASTGIWFCMHQAFLYQGEYLKGTLPSNTYFFLVFEIPPLWLHSLGKIFVLYGLILLLGISVIKVALGVLAQLGWLPR